MNFNLLSHINYGRSFLNRIDIKEICELNKAIRAMNKDIADYKDDDKNEFAFMAHFKKVGECVAKKDQRKVLWDRVKNRRAKMAR
tara:strand:+ start:195 stop:449 length:255 start_codon:yes stop_codon:yes gene_type:complete